MRENDVISKGSCGFPPCDPLLYAESFVFIREKNKKYLLLQFKNLRKETLTALDITVECFGAGEEKLCEKRVVVGGLEAAENASFVLGYKIAVPENCVSFNVCINRERYVDHYYLPRDGFSAQVFAPSSADSPQTCSARVVKGLSCAKNQTIEGAVRVCRPKFPLWLAFVTFAIFLAIIGMLIYGASTYGDDSDRFLKYGIMYSFENGDKSDGSPLYVSGIYGSKKKYKNITIEANIDGHPVKQINNVAFQGCYNLETVEFKGEIKIGAMAFAHCIKLKKINFEKVISVEDSAFYQCESLQNVYADNLEYIGERAFEMCTALTEFVVGESEKPLVVGHSLFNNCENLKSIEIMREIITENEYTQGIFRGANNLESLHIKFLSPQQTLRTLLAYNFFSGDLVVDNMVNIPQNFCEYANIRSVTVKNLTEPIVGQCAFYKCKNLERVELPNIVSVGESAFEGSGIKSFDGGFLREIGARAFKDCAELWKVDFSGNTTLERIEDMAFSACTDLKKIDIPDSVEYMGYDIFAYSNLEELVLPYLGSDRQSLRGIYYFVNSEQTSLQKVELRSGEMLPDGAFTNCQSLKTVILPDTMKRIGNNAFYVCKGLENIKMPEALEEIGDDAFNGCSALVGTNLPYGVKRIGDRAFAFCGAMKEITLPASLQYCAENAFDGCLRLYEIRNESNVVLPADIAENVLKIYKNGESSVPKVSQDGFTFGYFDEGWVMIEYPKQQVWTVLPISFVYEDAIVNRYKIADYLFSGDKFITIVEISSAVTELGKGTFSGCSKLEIVKFSEGTLLTYLPDNIFSYCNLLREIALPNGIKSIGQEAFKNCSYMLSVVLPTSLISVGQNAFIDCTKLFTVYNLSSLPLEIGAESYGYVAYYAEEIFTTLSDE